MSEKDFLQELQSVDAARWIVAMGEVATADLSDVAFAKVADLVAHPNESVREAALYCLMDKPDTRAIPFLIAVAISGEYKDNPYETLSYYAFPDSVICKTSLS